MDTNIKQYADSRNLKALKYIFVDALDADPTFEQYEEAYNYCKSIPGLLEIHAELTPFVYDRTQWTESYWNALKMDLITNFSDRRMMHMCEVAKVLMADKVNRILEEREQRASQTTVTPSSVTAPTTGERVVASGAKQKKLEEQERQKLEEAKRKLAEEEAKKEAARSKTDAARRREAVNDGWVDRTKQASSTRRPSSTSPKKALGAAITAAVVIVIAAVIAVLVLK